jgi:hypothetical protein
VLQDELPKRKNVDVRVALLKNSSAVVTDGNHRGVRLEGDIVWRCLPTFTDGWRHDVFKLFHFVLVGTATNDFYLKTLFQVVLNAQTQFRIIPCEDTAGDVSEAIISHNWNFFRCKYTTVHGKFVYLHQGLFR